MAKSQALMAADNGRADSKSPSSSPSCSSRRPSSHSADLALDVTQAASSPDTTVTDMSEPHPQRARESDDEDIFSTSPDLPAADRQGRFTRGNASTARIDSTTAAAGTAAPLSDVPALRRALLTDGYRAGVAAAKADPIVAQAAFDSGFAVGARLGLRAGWALGVLEQGGMSEATNAPNASRSTDDSGKMKLENEDVASQARRELAVAEYMRTSGLERAVAATDEDGDGGDASVAALPVMPVPWPALDTWTARAHEAAQRQGRSQDSTHQQDVGG